MTESQTQVHIPEEVQRLVRLERIFMPHVRKQRDVLYKNEPNENDPRFVHYTTADNALKIIGSKRLWMRNTTCMSDYREVQHGFDMLAKFFSSDSTGLAAFREALDASAPGAAQEASNCLTSGGLIFASTLTLHQFPNMTALQTCTGGSLCGALSEITPLALL